MSLRDDFTAEEDRLCRHLPSVEIDFNPQAWMSPNVIDSTGSYAYALNIPQLGEVKPGFLFYKPIMDDAINAMGRLNICNRDDMAARLHEDGLFYLGDALPETGHVIAFFTRDVRKADKKECGHETLCVRRDSNGGWSYRVRAGCPSPSLPQQTDWIKQPIRDIKTAQFGPYKNFLGFAGLPYEGLFYYQRLTLNAEDLAPFSGLSPALPQAGLALHL